MIRWRAFYHCTQERPQVLTRHRQWWTDDQEIRSDIFHTAWRHSSFCFPRGE